MMPEITRAVGVPRALVVPFDLGRPFGDPGDVTVQHAALRALLELCNRGGESFDHLRYQI
jgi:hypothetical protein